MSREFAVATVDAIPVGSHWVVRAGNRELGIFNIEGRFYALPNLCPHQRGPLCSGRVSGALEANEATGWRFSWQHEGEVVTCPWHAQEFHIPTGTCLAFPEIKLKSFDVRVVDDEILVTIG
jgi:nitrite reductase (NADH) small subunit